MNIAQKIIIPQKSIFRTIFLYVGQGEATLLVIPSKDKFLYALVDCNVAKKTEGIDLVKMLKDLLGNNSLDFFINTHPHNDHLCGLKEIYDSIGIKELWHSGHKPSRGHEQAYKELSEVIKKIGDSNVYQMLGTNEENKLNGEQHEIGDIFYHILSPAEYVCDDIEGESGEKRDKRIHEQCGVIRFSYGKDPGRILITGDSDLCAWKEHITNYHKDHLTANVLSASHHGSRTFFMDKEGDDEYIDHLEEIYPMYLIVSAPKQSESEHDHPHDDAMRIYKKYVDESNLIHLGNFNKKRVCVIVDVDNEGNLDISIDSELLEKYQFGEDSKSDSTSTKAKLSTIYPITKLDNKPMGRI